MNPSSSTGVGPVNRSEALRKNALSLAMLAVMAVLSFRLHREWKNAPEYASIPSYRRVDWWVLSARCAQERRVVLLACGPQGKLYPIEDVSPTDDRGHVLLLDLLALLKSMPASRVDLVRINLAINAAGVIVLSIFLWRLGMPWAAVGSLAAGGYLFPISVRIAGPDVPAAFLGIFALAAAPVLWLSVPGWDLTSSPRNWVYGIISAGTLVVAVLLRQAIGLVGAAGAIIVLIIGWARNRPASWRTSLPYASVLLVIGVITQSTPLLLAARNFFIPLSPAHLIETHGVAHMLYQGLGTEPNPWGIISGDDASGHEAIQKINPAAGYGTPLYYREIGKLYLKIVTTQPLAVFSIYARKMLRTAGLPLKVFGLPYVWYLVLIGLGLLKIWSQEGWESIQLRAAAAFWGFLLLFLSQAVFIFPEVRFIYPAKFGILVLLSIGLDLIVRRLSAAGR